MFKFHILIDANIQNLYQLTKLGGVNFRFLIFVTGCTLAGIETGGSRRSVRSVGNSMSGRREEPANPFLEYAPDCRPKSGKDLEFFTCLVKRFTRLVKFFTCLVNIFTQTQKNPVKYPVANKHDKNVPHVLAQGGSTCHTRPASGNRKKRKIIHCPCWRQRLPVVFCRRQTLSSGRHWSRGVRTRRRHTGGWRLRGRAARSAVRPLHPVCGLRP